jgi:nucleoid DNA-binding protein
MPYKHADTVKNRFTGKKIHRNDLIRRTADETGFLKDDVKEVIYAWGRLVEKEVADLNKVQISDYMTLFIDKMPGRKMHLRKLGKAENALIEFAFYLFPKLSIETSYRKHVQQHTAERISRGELKEPPELPLKENNQ